MDAFNNLMSLRYQFQSICMVELFRDVLIDRVAKHHCRSPLRSTEVVEAQEAGTCKLRWQKVKVKVILKNGERMKIAIEFCNNK
jgi:hypothetical protein